MSDEDKKEHWSKEKSHPNWPYVPAQFTSTNQPSKRGRPLKYTTTLKERGYKISEVNDCIQVLLALTEKECLKIVDDEERTMLERVVAGAILKSFERRSLFNIETLLTRVYGKPKELSENIGLQKILVEYVNPNNPVIPTTSGATDGIESAEEV